MAWRSAPGSERVRNYLIRQMLR